MALSDVIRRRLLAWLFSDLSVARAGRRACICGRLGCVGQDGKRIEEMSRQFNSVGSRYAGDGRQPLAGDAIPAPLVRAIAHAIDELLVSVEAEGFGDPLCERCSAAITGDQIGRGLDLMHTPIFGKIFRQVNSEFSEACSGAFGASGGHHRQMPPPERKTENVEIGRRLYVTRRALWPDMTLRQFASLIGEDENKLSKYEKGAAAPPRALIRKLKRLWRIDFDWIYDGDPSGLPAELQQKLLQTQALVEDE